jgi:alkaline phosphatase D
MHRRHALTLLTRSAAAVALGSLFTASTGPHARPPAFEKPRFTNYPFTLGVASGMPRPHSVVLWTRLAPEPYEKGGGLPELPVPVRWELADDEHFGRIVQRGEIAAHPEHAHSVHAEVTHLEHGRSYFYRFISGDAVSPIGRTRTAPPEDAPVQRLRLALASCQHYEQGHYAAHREIAARDVDFVLFVGDYVYESTNPDYIVRPHEGRPPTRLEMFRQRHATYKLDAHLRAAHAAHPWVLTRDDHEVENDYADMHSWTGRDADAFLRRRASSMRTLGSLTLCRSLLEAGLVDRFRVVVFPVITGSTGSDWIYDGYPDVALDMIASRTFDDRIQLLEYVPRVLTGPPGTDGPDD